MKMAGIVCGGGGDHLPRIVTHYKLMSYANGKMNLTTFCPYRFQIGKVDGSRVRFLKVETFIFDRLKDRHQLSILINILSIPNSGSNLEDEKRKFLAHYERHNSGVFRYAE